MNSTNCTEERDKNDSSIFLVHCLTRGQSIGLTLVAEVGFVSLISVFYVFFIIFRNIARYIRRGTRGRWHIVQQPMDLFMLSLFSADFTQALGAVMDVIWIKEGKVEIGGFCTAQGVIKQLGETGVAMSTLMIAIYTFMGVWWGKGNSVYMAGLVLGAVWLFILLMVIIANTTKGHYLTPTPYWCWISGHYRSLRLWGEYIWFWITLFLSLLGYIPLFFWSRGNITVDDHTWWKFHIHRARTLDDRDDNKRFALHLIAYPLVYSVLILPLSIVRWTKGNNQSSAATLFVIAIFGLSGTFNAILLLSTRPNSILFGRGEDHVGHAPPDLARNVSDNTIARDAGESHKDDSIQLGRLPSRASNR